eukprot:m.65417 g.65417  ORF g.65417 m.65417 type:complete len:248 (+) comp12056_c0_seq1:1069-1812(+)
MYFQILMLLLLVLISREQCIASFGHFMVCALLHLGMINVPCLCCASSWNDHWPWCVAWLFRFRGWDGVTPFEEPPLFYEGVDDFTADMLCNISTEIQEVKHKINEEYPDIDLSAVVHVTDWIKRAYQGQISDTTSLGSCIRTNSAYKGLTHAMKKVEGGYVPNFDYRYTSEDIPMGLVVTRGIAQLCDVPTPHLDKVLNWFEEHVPKSFLVEGKLTGTDIATTRCPQRYGYTDLRQFLVASRLVSAE